MPILPLDQVRDPVQRVVAILDIAVGREIATFRLELAALVLDRKHKTVACEETRHRETFATVDRSTLVVGRTHQDGAHRPIESLRYVEIRGETDPVTHLGKMTALETNLVGTHLGQAGCLPADRKSQRNPKRPGRASKLEAQSHSLASPRGQSSVVARGPQVYSVARHATTQLVLMARSRARTQETMPGTGLECLHTVKSIVSTHTNVAHDCRPVSPKGTRVKPTDRCSPTFSRREFASTGVPG